MAELKIHSEIDVDQMDDSTPNPTVGPQLETEQLTDVRQLEDVGDKEVVQESKKEEWKPEERDESPTDNNEETNQALDAHQQPKVNIEQCNVMNVLKSDESEAGKKSETLLEENQQLREKVQQLMSLVQLNTMPTTNIVQCPIINQQNSSELKLNGMHSVMMTGKTMSPVEVAANLEVFEWDVDDIQPQPHYLPLYRRKSDMFELLGYHVGAKVVLLYTYKKSKGLMEGDIYLHLGSLKNTKKAIGSRALPKFTCVVKDLSNGSEKRDKIEKKFAGFKKSIKFKRHVCEWTTFDHFLCPPYMQDNCLKIAILIEPPSMVHSYASSDGALDWTVDNYTIKKQMEADGLVECQESPYFYTSPQGYRVQLTLSLTKLNAQLQFLTGNFDSTLSRRFPHKVTLTILSQNDQSMNLAFKKNSKKPKSTSFDLREASPSGLESYVKDDALILRATVVESKCSTGCRFW